jgi:soluble lytic murein transglycosylase-like protein
MAAHKSAEVRRRRRKRRFGKLVFAAATLSATPSHVKARPLFPSVSTTITGFEAARPEGLFEGLIQEAAHVHGVDPALIRAVMQAESRFDPTVVSPGGAQGLMQLMPALAKELGVADPLDPRDNIMGGAKYLKQLLDANNGNLRLALASYNAGPANVKRFNGVPPFKETRDYVRKVIDLLDDAQ